jgi:uncharacterized membrane protein HdeD (DUF308 family)/pimeloyl-ACP methyl ester carboxylesterase
MSTPLPGRFARRLPRWVRFGVGLGCAVLGVVLVTRPFTSLSVLVWLVAVAAVATGVTRWSAARATTGRLDDAVAAGWVLLGLLVAAWPDLTVRGIAVIVGVAMVLGGFAEVVSGVRGTTDERTSSVLRGLASATFGALALIWPDVTILVVAVVFGARTVVFGLSEALVAARGERAAPQAATGRRSLLHRGVRTVAAAAALVIAVVLAGVSARLRAGEPVVSAFYDTPEAVPPDPGQLVRVEAYDDVPTGAEGWRILYTTTRADGEPSVASGVVVAPTGIDGPLPVVAWAHGTTGVARRCAPSVLDEGLEAGAFFLSDGVMGNGWALVATDYVGLGTEGPHPYLVGEPSARSVLDAVRAARQLGDVELADQTVVWGHSQGGGAALWTGQIAPDYAPDADIIGVAALAPASDVAGLVDNLARIRGGSLFASFVLTGYSATYPDVGFDDYVVPTAQTNVRALASRCLAEPAVLASVLASVTTGMSVFEDGLADGALAARLVENVPTGPFEMPLLVAQGEDDGLVVPAVQAAFVEELCDEGNDVEFRSYPGRDHVPLVEADSPLVDDLLEWTRQRFSSEPFTGNCSA